MERRDSKNSKNNASKQKQKEKVGKSKSDDRGETDERKGKAVGLVRTKPCREIYRPPSMRKGRQNSGGELSQDNLPSPSSSFGSNSNYNPSAVSRPTSGSNNRHCQFNVHAKEFQYAPNTSPLSYSRSQPNPFYSSNDHYYQNDLKTPTILASSGCYPLQQSKSSGNVNNFYHLWAQQQQQQQQPLNPQSMSKNRGAGHPSLIQESTASGLDTLEGQYFRLQQSKSSGNVPNGKFREQQQQQQQQRNGKTVRFDCDSQQKNHPDLTGGHLTSMEDRFSRMQLEVDMNDKSFAPLQIEGLPIKNNQVMLGGTGGMQRNYPEGYSSPKIQSKFQRHPQLQKSQTTFYMPLSSTSTGQEMEAVASSSSSLLKRSKSYTPKTNTIQMNSSSKMQLSNPIPTTNNPMQMPMSISSVSNISASSDFQIRKWPKVIQELITTGVIGADRVPARHRIIMVGNIFNFLLSESDFDIVQEFKDDDTNKKELSTESKDNGTEKKDDVDILGPSTKNANATETGQNSRTEQLQDTVSTNPQELIASSVNIFLYFIQREKDRTVMETVLNTCFATFQKLQKLSLKPDEVIENLPSEEQQQKNRGGAVNKKLGIFLQFLSAMYTKVKIIRLQKSQQPGMKNIDELHNSILSLLCDSCLVTLRSPLFQTCEIMDLLFTIMTSIGRDMEGTFPPKMKQILAAVRDALLGIQPYSNVPTEVSSPNVQKTLMQLIELHAANWHLPASAVRYYYSNPGSGY